MYCTVARQLIVVSGRGASFYAESSKGLKTGLQNKQYIGDEDVAKDLAILKMSIAFLLY